MGPRPTETDPIVLAAPTNGRRSWSFRRNRRVFALSALAMALAIAMVVVATSILRRSAYSSSYPTRVAPIGQRAPPINATIPARRQAIVVLGDSTTQYGGEAQGWEVLLHETYVRTLDTFNRGLSGYNTRVYLQYAMPGIIEEATHYYDPLVVVLWFGVNDATLVNGPNRAQHVPVDEYKANLIAMIEQFRNATSNANVVLLSPVYVDEKQRRRAVGTPLDRNNEETARYASACAEIKEQVFKDDDKVGFVDVYGYFLYEYPSDKSRAEMLKDGLHFTPVGNRVFYELVKDKIEEMVSSSVLKKPQFPFDTEIFHY